MVEIPLAGGLHGGEEGVIIDEVIAAGEIIVVAGE